MKIWLKGARLRTLPLAIAPVLMGAGIAELSKKFDLTLTLLALAVALFLQIGVNYANDYSDGIRGTDDNRVGPARLTGGGLAKPKMVLLAALICFGVAAVFGLVITVITGLWWFIAVGAVCIVAAWFYTGGKKPYGYLGLGELVVFVFFGLVATVGTDYIQERELNFFAVYAGVMAGCFATAVLLINNIRDIDTDIKSNKRTLASRIGRKPALFLFSLLILTPFVLVTLFWIFAPATFLVNLLIIPALIILIIANTGKDAKSLILALQLTSLLSVSFAAL
ncbi:MAG: 1,4-dihydroxy-2-naphthoate polyprenyltransferase, partial [Acidobacteria bacterium]|nr:1,4-dihydroxy-2-naphthoate polyprenyltransferase [Acidobacteriota bacterium]